MAPGIDVSSYQGDPDWAAVAGAGVTWGIAKATQGLGYTSPDFARQFSGMISAGLVAGAYHFLMPGNAAAQADHFTSTVGTLPEAGVFWMCDFEGNPLPSAADLAEFCSAVAAAWPYAQGCIYGNQSDLTAGGAPGLGLPLILAAYGPNDGVEHPVTIPAGWHVVAHQYTSVGQVPGVSGYVDRDDFFGDVRSFPTPRPHPGGTVYPTPWTATDVVASLNAPGGGAWLVTRAGNIYAVNCPDLGMPAGQPYWGTRQAASLEPRTDGGYDVIDTAGERYSYPA